MSQRKNLVNALRFLSIDAVERAKSGHPGAPMGMAEMAEALWSKYLKHNPAESKWVNRDRVVFSNGHASALYYSLLHLSGYDLSIEELKNFRQFESLTPGHPEYGVTKGVDVTTGPLGQGIATAVGLAIAEKNLATIYNKPDFPIIDHKTYVFLGDGCLMEGISQEACSLAGTLGLGKLIALYDSNNISIDGEISSWFSEDVAARFRALNWQVIDEIDGQNSDALDRAIAEAISETQKPSLIICKTTIGYGSPNKAGSSSCHGSPLGADELQKTRENLAWNYAPFEIPSEIYQAFDARPKGAKEFADWSALFAKYSDTYFDLANELTLRLTGAAAKDTSALKKELVQTALSNGKALATRTFSQNILNAINTYYPQLFGGSADLSPSNNTSHNNSKAITATDFSGNYMHYGVREFAMSAIMNGLALHGGYIPYAGTFLVFSDYLKSAIRSAALMNIKAIWVLTHDSIGVGEDGPTHQPIEQIPALRLIPNLELWRPATYLETLVAWFEALDYNNPTCLALSRQSLEAIPHTEAHFTLIKRGGYILLDCVGQADVILISSGSELAIAFEATKRLQAEGVQARLVSMPNVNRFAKEERAYQAMVLPKNVRKRVAIEATNCDLWYKYVGLDGAVIGMNSFGKSAPADKLFAHFGFSVENIIKTVNDLK